jgi:hypothetical protein
MKPDLFFYGLMKLAYYVKTNATAAAMGDSAGGGSIGDFQGLGGGLKLGSLLGAIGNGGQGEQ